VVLDVIIGSVTFTGSLIASGKLQGLIAGKPILIPGGRIVTLALAAVAVGGALFLFAGNVSSPVLMLVIAAALIFGITMVLPIGGADMPVVISLLNAFTGTAVAMAGFVLENDVLIIAGALVGASGAILTKLMADAMNRSVMNIMIGGFGGGEGTAGGAVEGGGTVRSIGADDVADEVLGLSLGIRIRVGHRRELRKIIARRARCPRSYSAQGAPARNARTIKGFRPRRENP